MLAQRCPFWRELSVNGEFKVIIIIISGLTCQLVCVYMSMLHGNIIIMVILLTRAKLFQTFFL